MDDPRRHGEHPPFGPNRGYAVGPIVNGRQRTGHQENDHHDRPMARPDPENPAERSSHNHRRSNTGNAFHATNGTKAFGATTGHGHRSPGCCRQVLRHCGAIRRKTWPLADNRSTHIRHTPPGSAHPVCNLAEQPNRVGVSPTRIIIGKQRSEIAQISSCQQSISDGMGWHIGIGMPRKSAFASEDHSTQNQRSVIVAEPVDVKTLAHPHITDCIHLATSVRHDATRPGQILRSGDLAIAHVPGHDDNHSAGCLNH